MVGFINRRLLYIGLCLLFIPCIAIAEIYKTVDENGRIIFTDKPSISAEKIEVDTSLIGATGAGQNNKQVVMYSTAWWF